LAILFFGSYLSAILRRLKPPSEKNQQSVDINNACLEKRPRPSSLLRIVLETTYLLSISDRGSNPQPGFAGRQSQVLL
jgi:hypothetical protein